MTFDEATSATQKALSSLGRARADTGAWDDERRRQFDRGSAASLERTGKDLLKALKSAEEKIERANRLLTE